MPIDMLTIQFILNAWLILIRFINIQIDILELKGSSYVRLLLLKSSVYVSNLIRGFLEVDFFCISKF